MQTVRDADDQVYLLLERGERSCRVRDPVTGTERSVRSETLEAASVPVLRAIGRAASSTIGARLNTIVDDRTLGLLCEIRRREPVGVRPLLDDYGLCESDLHGTVGELRAAGLIEPAALDAFALSEAGYRTTSRAHSLLAESRE
jgi:hypothetical protein